MRLALATLVAALSPVAHAGSFDLAHTGRLLDGAGAPLSGDHRVELDLVDVGSGAVLETWDFDPVELVDGFYAVTLTGLDTSWFSGDTALAVRVDGAAAGPQAPLTSVPSALVAHAIPVVTALPTPCAKGMLVYDDSADLVRVCGASGWTALASGHDIIDAADGRRFADGTFAPDCNGYLHPPPGYAYSGATGDGVYRIDPDGAGPAAPRAARCDMSTDGGGWTLLATLRSIASTENALTVWAPWSHDWFATAHGDPTSLTDDFSNQPFDDFRARIDGDAILRFSTAAPGPWRYTFGMTQSDWDLWNTTWTDPGNNVRLIGPFNRANVQVSTSLDLSNPVTARVNGHWDSGYVLWGSGSGQGFADTEGLGARYHIATSGTAWAYVAGTAQSGLFHLWLR